MTEEIAISESELQVANLVEIVQTAPDILRSNRTRHDKAVEYGNNLLTKAEENGMSYDLDKLMSDYQDKLKTTLKTIKEARQPFTQLVDAVSSQFTSLEADINPTGKANIYFNIQRVRDIYVAEKIEAQKKKDALILMQQNKDKETIDIEKQVEINVNSDFNSYLSGVKRAMNNIFEGMTLESSKSIGKVLNATPMGLSQQSFDLLGNRAYWPQYITKDEAQEILKAKKTEELFTDLNDVCGIDLSEYRRELIEKIPSKIKELEAIAAAGIEEKARLEKEATDRKNLEAQRLLDEAEKKAKEAAQSAEVAAAGKTFEATIATQAQLFQAEAPKTKDGYFITVNHRAGYALLFQFWFEKEGHGLTADKIEKKTIGQMKAFAEAYAIKNDEKIVSPLLFYKETYKAK